VLEVSLGIDLDGVDLGGAHVLDLSSDDILQRCKGLVDSQPPTPVVNALVGGLRESYQRRPVHEMLVDLTEQVAERWRAGARDWDTHEALRHLAQAFKFGVRPDDLDLVIKMCTDPVFTYEGDIEDLRGYWFESLGKIRDDRAGKICRDIIDADQGHWEDLRLASAIQALRRVWDDTDHARVSRIAEQHPDSFVRKVAKRSLAQH
jgi:hypothetical protein